MRSHGTSNSNDFYVSVERFLPTITMMHVRPHTLTTAFCFQSSVHDSVPEMGCWYLFSVNVSGKGSTAHCIYHVYAQVCTALQFKMVHNNWFSISERQGEKNIIFSVRMEWYNIHSCHVGKFLLYVVKLVS
ncbi:hypothetical protein TRVL_07964 [Trypanosoma vivax]|nr:hypothetical protein TRVL_07964 [Trypanosoma vivax]